MLTGGHDSSGSSYLKEFIHLFEILAKWSYEVSHQVHQGSYRECFTSSLTFTLGLIT